MTRHQLPVRPDRSCALLLLSDKVRAFPPTRATLAHARLTPLLPAACSCTCVALREPGANRGGGAAKRPRTARNSAAAPVMEPQELVCPISHELFRDPVTTSAGHTYERMALLQAWAQRSYEGAVRDPLTNAALPSRKLYPCWLARRQVRPLQRASPFRPLLWF